MKKTFRLLTLLFMIFGLAACAEKTTSANQLPVFFGANDITLPYGTTSFDPLSGITVSDFEDGNLTGSIQVNNPVNLAKSGRYTVTLTVTDSANNVVVESYEVVVEPGPEEAKVLADVNAIQLTLDETGNYTLPTVGSVNNSTIIWSTDRPDIITKKGFVMKPGIGVEPITVTLTANVKNGTFKSDYLFEIIVEGNTELNGITSSKTLPFEGTSEEYVVANQEAVKIFFADNGALPYIDVETFINLIDGAIDSSIVEITPQGEDQLKVEYTAEFEDFDGTMVSETYWALIDFSDNTFTVNNFSFFENYVAETTSDYGEGLTYVDADYVDGEEVTIPLGFYNFDLLIHSDNSTTYYLMPLHVADLLFAGGLYYDVYYNGDKLWGIDTFTISSPDEEGELLLDEIRTSSFNSKTAPSDIRWATYNFLALSLDYFYGLRDRYDVNSSYEIISSHAKDLITGTDQFMYQKVFNIANGLDDLHTSHVFTGYYEAPFVIQLALNDLGPRTLGFYNGLWSVQDLLDAKYGSYDDIPESALIDSGKTAVIYLSGFTIDTPDEFKVIMDSLPATVENVVIDLSYNTGGNLGAVLRIFGYMTESTIMYHSQNPADGATVTYYIESDYVAYDYNWYIVTSSVTFSAANLMASIAKEQGIATVIGKNSSGGASSIGAIYSPDGSCLLISTNNVLSTRVGSEVDGYEYISIEDGITVEYLMSNVTSDSQIISTIATVQTEK